MLICFEDDPKIGYLQKLILFFYTLRQSDVAITIKVCLLILSNFGYFLSFIINFKILIYLCLSI